jgi:hypothetical protein
MKRAWLTLLLATAACGGGSSLGGDVGGSWRAVLGNRDVYTFAADGTWTLDTQAGTHSGTYSTASDAITLDELGVIVTLPYAVNDDVLFMPAFVPDDDGADPVASWTGFSANPQIRTDIRAIFADDMTVHLVNVHGATSDSFDGTWQQTGETVESTFDIEGSVSVVDQTLRGGLLGTAFDRVR